MAVTPSLFQLSDGQAKKQKMEDGSAASAGTAHADELEAYGTDELSIERTKFYKAREGKRRVDSAMAVMDDVFIDVIMEIAHVSRRPFAHLHRWLTKVITPYEIDGDLRRPSKARGLG